MRRQLPFDFVEVSPPPTFAEQIPRQFERPTAIVEGDSIVPPALGAEVPFPALAFHRDDQQTSRQAAESMVGRAGAHRESILTAMRLFGPATGHELAARLGLEYVQVAKRLTELAAADLIYRREFRDAGDPKRQPTYQTRPSPSGREACVWHLNPLAK